MLQETKDALIEMGYLGNKTGVKAYLTDLAEEHGVDYYTVVNLYYVLGEEELFDGLVNAMEDYSDDMSY